MGDTQATPTGVVVPHKADGRGNALSWFAAQLIRLLGLSLRWRWDDRAGLLEGRFKEPVIFCIWHNRLALCLLLYRRFVRLSRQPGRRMAAMVSASRDGGLLARVLERFGVQPVRGSTSRRGPQALKEMTTHARHGLDLAITPDGPRGPLYRIQSGIISLGQLTGAPVVPVSYHLSWKVCLKSWDRFQIPLPFARCEVILGEPLDIPRRLDDDEAQQMIDELQRRMDAITCDDG